MPPHRALLPLVLAAILTGGASWAEAPAIPGLAGASLLPGWVTPEGNRMTALQLDLQPGWKTYWRAPGDAGIGPSFDWTGSQNLGAVTIHWPAPEVIDSGGVRTFGFHDRLVLPIEVAAAVPGQPVTLQAAVDFGLCRDVCVPAHVRLSAAPPGAAVDAGIEAALKAVPRTSEEQPACRMTPIADGVRVEARLPAEVGVTGTPAAAMELTGDDAGGQVWVSTPEVVADASGITIAADFVPPAAKPFALEPSTLRLTLIGEGGAVETLGCAP